MTDFTKIHTPRDCFSYRTGSFISQTMQPTPFAIGPI